MFMSLSPLVLTLGVLALLVVILAIWVIRLEIKIRKLLATKNTARLDETIDTLATNLREVNEFQQSASNHLHDLERRMQRTIRGVDTVRFNPFSGDGSGGNHSFATALMNEHGDGVVISSLYTRERTNVFSKPIGELQPHQELSDEEHEVMKRAHANARR